MAEVTPPPVAATDTVVVMLTLLLPVQDGVVLEAVVHTTGSMEAIATEAEATEANKEAAEC